MIIIMRYNSMRPVHRIKHVVDFQQALPVNTQLPQDIAIAKDAPALANTEQVMLGSKVNAIFANIQCVASETSTTATPNIYLIFVKNPGNNLVFANGNVVGSDDNKKFVFHQEMNMISALDGEIPRTLFKGVIMVPKHMRRMGPNDRLIVYLFTPSTGVAVNICGQFHYKEFR